MQNVVTRQEPQNVQEDFSGQALDVGFVGWQVNGKLQDVIAEYAPDVVLEMFIFLEFF